MSKRMGNPAVIKCMGYFSTWRRSNKLPWFINCERIGGKSPKRKRERKKEYNYAIFLQQIRLCFKIYL
tara:strand:+ start:617 stop:820 length:204 start_codon:yes stop_codon:yes gene_type:complete